MTFRAGRQRRGTVCGARNPGRRAATGCENPRRKSAEPTASSS